MRKTVLTRCNYSDCPISSQDDDLIREHLIKEFGDYLHTGCGGHPHGRNGFILDEDVELPEYEGDKGHNLPTILRAGKYTIAQGGTHGGATFFGLEIINLETKEHLYINVGVRHGRTVDWRGCRKLNEK